MYGYELTYAHGEYVMSGGRAATAQESTLVRVIDADGREGWGEVATLAGTYLPAFTGSARAAIERLAPELIGVDAANPGAVNAAMDATLLGHHHGKSPLDIACWDVFGQTVGCPVGALLGGVVNPSFPLYEAVPLTAPTEMAAFVTRRTAAGINAFQVKVGNEPRIDAERMRHVIAAARPDATIIGDSNGGWSLQDAIIAVGLLADLPVYVEQPCREHDANVIVSRKTRLPLILDESVVGLADLFRARDEASAGSVNIKLSRVGGLTAARRMRDTAVALGMSVCLEDTWGGDVTSAAVAHLASSTPPRSLLTTSFFNDWTNEHVAGYQPRSVDGFGEAPSTPGLGVSVQVAPLGAPLATFR
jgi:L-alanine-DL-glutamate epimerase-like enolase superfamily enzyme